jgi:pimeloyl-ACP methyl ester carboxylesterase
LPLNYSASHEDDADASKTTQIALRMIPATDRDNYRGSILINPGGPGGSGTNAIARFGRNLSIVVGPQFDIVGFDPRGIGATTPAATCFDTDAQGQVWKLQEQAALSVNSSAPESIAYWRSRSKLVAERCASSEDAHALSFVDSKSVATDMVRIIEKLGQEKLQYWGFVSGIIQ